MNFDEEMFDGDDEMLEPKSLAERLGTTSPLKGEAISPYSGAVTVGEQRCSLLML